MTTRASDRFVLLNDFEVAYDRFSLKVVDATPHLEAAILLPMRAALKAVVADLQEYSQKRMQELIHAANLGPCYLLTLDGGSYFRDHDFSIEVTRACYRLKDIRGGPMFRLPRSPGHQLVQQAMRLREHYIHTGESRKVVLCDDGIGTGRSLESIVGLIRDVHLAISEIVVLVNPSQRRRVSHIDSHIDVRTLIQVETPFIWLSERDLFWGLPRSGLSFTGTHELSVEAGIPYTIDVPMVMQRIELAEDQAVEFRRRALELNVLFWEMIEDNERRELRIADCPRLQVLEQVTHPETRIVDFLRSINRPEYRVIE